MDCRMYSHNSHQFAPESGESSTRIKIEKLGLVEKQKFALHYDFGDDWMFIINVQKIVSEAEYKKPLVLKAKGTIEQYPVWDDEEDWDE